MAAAAGSTEPLLVDAAASLHRIAQRLTLPSETAVSAYLPLPAEMEGGRSDSARGHGARLPAFTCLKLLGECLAFSLARAADRLVALPYEMAVAQWIQLIGWYPRLRCRLHLAPAGGFRILLAPWWFVLPLAPWCPSSFRVLPVLPPVSFRHTPLVSRAP